MKTKGNQIEKYTNVLFWCIMVVVCLLSVLSFLSPSYANYKTMTEVDEEARVAQFEVTALTSTERFNELNFTNSTESETFVFTLTNNGETVIYVTAFELENDDDFPLPDYHFSPQSNFYLKSQESKEITLEIYGAEPSYFFDVEEKLHVRIKTEQVN